MPNQPKTPGTTARLPPDLRAELEAQAEAEGRTVSDIIRDALAAYLRGTK